MIQCEVCHWTAWAADIATIVGALGTFVAVGVAAYYGRKAYTVWKEELAYKLRRDILIAVYKVRDSIDILRKRGYSLHEKNQWDLDEAFKAQPYTNNQEFEAVIRGEALRYRWPVVQDALSELELISIKAEISYGKTLREKIDRVKRTAGWYGTSIDAYHHFIEIKDFDKADNIGMTIFGPRPDWDQIQDDPTSNQWAFVALSQHQKLQNTIGEVEKALILESR